MQKEEKGGIPPDRNAELQLIPERDAMAICHIATRVSM